MIVALGGTDRARRSSVNCKCTSENAQGHNNHPTPGKEHMNEFSTPTAKVIADSVSREGMRVTTLEVKMHRFVLAEFNTHRQFSRNSASSRAIPVAKQLVRVMEEPAMPIFWNYNQKGMTAGEECSEADTEEAITKWLTARDHAVDHAEYLLAIGEGGIHKSIVNRLLEPFMWHTVVVTATAWQNFFNQRCSPLAQPEMRAAAEAMRTAIEQSIPSDRAAGQWHLPYIDEEDWVWLGEAELGISSLIAVCAARCARVSYLTHDGIRDPREDLELYSRLVEARPMHASPLEHPCRPSEEDEWDLETNFAGWTQHRQEVERRANIKSWL